MLPLLLAVMLGLLAGAVSADPAVRVLALFPGKAMLEIDGKRRVMTAGAAGFREVRLIDADTDRALVEIAGQRRTLRLGSSVRASYARPEKREIRIVKDGRDGYFVDGLINGSPVRFLVDTGATSVAMSERHAARLGLRHRIDGKPVGVGTAGGSRMGHAISLDSLSIAGIRLNDVRAVVIDGDSPREVLLGMNVLSRFDIDQRENLLILRSKF